MAGRVSIVSEHGGYKEVVFDFDKVGYGKSHRVSRKGQVCPHTGKQEDILMVGSAMATYKKTVCPLDCPDSCGIIAKVVEGKVVSLKGDPDHGYTKGVICRKMRTYPERLYGTDRILHPMVRTGEKGKGEFRRISMAEAVRLFAEKLSETKAEFGGEAILPFQYAGNMGAANRNAGYGLYHKLGTSRLIETICSAAAGAAWALHCATMPGSPPEVAADSDIVVAWGINVRVSNMHFWRYIREARKKGGKLIVIDPYRNETAGKADHYLQVKPGGDSALAIGALKYLIEQGKIDRELLKEQTTGFETLEKYVLEESWALICSQSGIEKQDICWFGELLAANPSAFIRIGIGLSRNSRGGLSVRAIVCLAAALGLFSGLKGQGVLLSSKAFGGNSDLLRFPELAGQETREINMAHLGHALTTLDPPVKMFCVYSSNPLTVAPDASRVREGLKRDDMFTVVHEQVMTPTAKYADLIIPATTFLENMDLYTGYGHFYMGWVDRVVHPVGESISNFDLFQRVARELGFDDPPFHQEVEERLAAYAATMDGVPKGYRFDGPGHEGWVASSRRRVGQSALEHFGITFRFCVEGLPGITPIPCLIQGGEFEDRDMRSRYPFRLIIPPHKDLLNSTFGERFPADTGEVLIHPEDAARYDIASGDEVELQNFRGIAKRRARVTKDTGEGLLVAEGLFWQTGEEPSGINDVTSQKTTDIAGGPTFHESRVTVRLVSRER